MDEEKALDSVSPLLLMLTMLGISLLSGLSAMVTLGILIGLTKSQLLSQTAASLTNLVVYLILFTWLKTRLEKLGTNMRSFVPPIAKEFNWYKFIALFLCLYFFLWGLSTLELQVKGLLFKNTAKAADNFFGPFSPGSAIAGFLHAVVLAPLVEEILFRGLLLHRLTLTQSVPKAVIYTSAIFSLVHMDIYLLTRFFLGLSLALLYLKTKTLLVPIIFHACYNFISFIAWILVSTKTATATAPVFFLLMFFALFGAAWFFRKNWPSKTCDLPVVPGLRRITPLPSDTPSYENGSGI